MGGVCDQRLNTVVARLSGFNPERILNPSGAHCDASVFRDDYRQCTNKATNKRGRWQLCTPHSRLDELEVMVDNENQR